MNILWQDQFTNQEMFERAGPNNIELNLLNIQMS